MHSYRPSGFGRSASLGCRAAVALCSAMTLALLIGCTGGARQTQRPLDNDYFVESDRAYLRLPSQLLGAELELEEVGPELVRCYELQASTGAWDVTHVSLELVVLGGEFQARVVQERNNLSESVASCIDRATLTWSFDPERSHEGEVIPLEFGPKEPPIVP